MRLPRGQSAIIDHRKVADYLLSPTHPIGANKARVFKSALGLTAEGALFLIAWLKDAAANGEVIEGRRDRFGCRYQIDFEMKLEGRSALIRSAWLCLTTAQHRHF